MSEAALQRFVLLDGVFWRSSPWHWTVQLRNDNA